MTLIAVGQRVHAVAGQHVSNAIHPERKTAESVAALGVGNFDKPVEALRDSGIVFGFFDAFELNGAALQPRFSRISDPVAVEVVEHQAADQAVVDCVHSDRHRNDV